MLFVKPLSGKLKRDTETFGKMDPFCRIKLGLQEQESKVHSNGGKFPAWNDTLAFRRNDENLMTVEVWDKDTFNNDLIGECTISVVSVMEKKKSSEWYTLSYKGKNAGEVLLDIEWKNEVKQLTPQFNSGMNAQPFSPQYGVTYMLPQMYQQQPVYPQQQMMQPQPQPMYSQPMQQPMYNQPSYSQPPTYVQPNYGSQPMYPQQQVSQPVYYQSQPQPQPTFQGQGFYQGQQQPGPQQNFYAPPGY